MDREKKVPKDFPLAEKPYEIEDIGVSSSLFEDPNLIWDEKERQDYVYSVDFAPQPHPDDSSRLAMYLTLTVYVTPRNIDAGDVSEEAPETLAKLSTFIACSGIELETNDREEGAYTFELLVDILQTLVDATRGIFADRLNHTKISGLTVLPPVDAGALWRKKVESTLTKSNDS